MKEERQEPIIQKPSAEYQFLIDVRQHLLGLVAVIEKYIEWSPTTAEKARYWKQQTCDVTHTDYPEYEIDEM